MAAGIYEVLLILIVLLLCMLWRPRPESAPRPPEVNRGRSGEIRRCWDSQQPRAAKKKIIGQADAEKRGRSAVKRGRGR